MNKRRICEETEACYKLVHHEFEGKSVKEAAKIMAVSEATVKRLLAEMEKIAPQCFPIIPRAEWSLWQAWLDNTTISDLAMEQGCSERTINRRIAKLQKQLDYTKPSTKTTLLGWRELIDEDIRERF